MKEREENMLEWVQLEFRGKLPEIVDDYHDIFPEKLPKGWPPKMEIEHAVKTDPEAQAPNKAPYRLGPAKQDKLEAWSSNQPLSRIGFIQPSENLYGVAILFVPRKTDGGRCALTTMHSISKPWKIGFCL